MLSLLSLLRNVENRHSHPGETTGDDGELKDEGRVKRGYRQILWQYKTDLCFDSCQFEGMTAASSIQPHKISVFLNNLGALF